MAQIDWRFMQPLDQSNQIANMAVGNAQINAGLAGMANAVTGYSDAIKQRNTDSILNALYQAQNSTQLPNVMTAVNALQQQYGRGYDQAAVRNAIDTRGSTLAQRDLQNINLQQAQAAQAAIPQINAMNAVRMQAAGASPEQINAMNAIQGIDNSSMVQQQVNDLRDNRDFNYRKGIDQRNYNHQLVREAVGDKQWGAGNERANLGTAMQLASFYERPAQSGWTTDANGNPVPYSSPAVTKGDALSAIMGSILNTESGMRHTDAKGNLIQSPKGALGIAQIMPATAAKPGYGMQPINLQTSSPQEQTAWANQYINRIAKAHNFNTEQAVAAYNAGPGAVQQAIKDGGSNWLSKLPKETQNYVPKVMGGVSSSAASSAVRGVPQASISKISTDYQSGIAKLNADYTNQGNKDQIKGSLAATGKGVDTWAASNRGKDNTWFTKASDLAAMAKQDPIFNQLPESAKVNILDGAFAKMNDVYSFQYVPDTQLKKFISQESQAYKQDRVNQFNAQKNALMETAYQGMVAQYQAIGQRPPSREGVRQMLDPQSPKQTPQPQPVPNKSPPVVNAEPVKTQVVPPTKTGIDIRNEQRQARVNAVNERLKREQAAEATKVAKDNPKPATGDVRIGSTNMSQKQLDDILKKYKVSSL